MSKTFDLAVVGATGAVGQAMLEVLAERKFPVGQVHALASERSAGKKVSFGNQSLTVENLDTFDFSKTQLGIFSPGASCLLYTSPSPRDATLSRMPSSA